MESLRASTDLAKVYAVAQVGDDATAEAWRAAEAHVVTSEHQSFARKVNDAWQTGDEPWLFLVGDDVAFHPGWLPVALARAAETGAQVVGTNDLGSAAVQSGDHAPHMLINRRYVVEQGASWDGPGVVCHPGYRHYYVDCEIVEAAKRRGVWASATDSIVEHLHPLFHKARRDEVYELARSYARHDQRLYIKRQRDWSV